MPSLRSPPILAIVLAGFALTVPAAMPARAQSNFLMADRTADAIWRIRDLDNSGAINDPAEVFLWFNATNAAGTIGPSNATSLGVSPCRVVLMGDQGLGA